jgi:HPt (histidine-containing phosphotransfer) domain-containing protein
MISSFFEAGIDDYFIKGNNFDNLVYILANFFIKVDNNFEILVDKNNNLLSKNEKDLQVINLNFINNFSTDEQKKIITLFNEDKQKIIANLKKNKEHLNHEIINSNIHSLKGILANIGAEKFANYIKNLNINLFFDNLSFDKTIKEIEILNNELNCEFEKILK